MCMFQTNWTSRQRKPAQPKHVKSLHSWVCTKEEISTLWADLTALKVIVIQLADKHFPTNTAEMKTKATQSKPCDEREENQHGHWYYKLSTWAVMIRIPTCIRTTVRFNLINWREEWYPWTQTEYKGGDGRKHRIKALAFQNTTNQYAHQTPVCDRMSLASTPTVASVLLNYKAKSLAASWYNYQIRTANNFDGTG